MFTSNESLIIRHLQVQPGGDLGGIAEACGLARSSCHVALTHLVELGVVEAVRRSESRATTYQVAPPEAVERAAQKLLADFRTAFAPVPTASKPKLVFTDSYVLPESALQELRARFDVVTFDESPNYVSDDLLLERSRSADVIVRYDFGCIDSAFLYQTPNLKAIVLPNCWPHNIDVDECERRGVQLHHADIVTQKYYAQTQLEYTVNALFTMLKPLHAAARHLSEETEYFWANFQGSELGGKKVGVLFNDSSIRSFVEVYRAFGCDVAATSTSPTPPLPALVDLDGYKSLDELWGWADVLLVVDPVHTDVTNLMASSGRMPEYFVVTTQYFAYDTARLRDLLVDGTIKGFAADYLNEELMAHLVNDGNDVTFTLIDLPSVLITPEMSVISTDSLKRSKAQVFEALKQLRV